MTQDGLQTLFLGSSIHLSPQDSHKPTLPGTKTIFVWEEASGAGRRPLNASASKRDLSARLSSGSYPPPITTHPTSDAPKRCRSLPHPSGCSFCLHADPCKPTQAPAVGAPPSVSSFPPASARHVLNTCPKMAQLLPPGTQGERHQ